MTCDVRCCNFRYSSSSFFLRSASNVRFTLAYSACIPSVASSSTESWSGRKCGATLSCSAIRRRAASCQMRKSGHVSSDHDHGFLQDYRMRTNAIKHWISCSASVRA